MFLAGFLASAAAAFAQGYTPMARDPAPDGAFSKKSKSSEATGVEKDGVYQETEVKHSWFSFNKPAEKTPEAQFERAEKFREKGSFKAAGKAYHALVITWPRSSLAPAAQQHYAEMLVAREQWEDAFEQYDVLLDRYVGEFDYEAVIQEQFALAKRVMLKRKGKLLLFGGFKAPERAIPLFESILKHAPRWNGAPEAQYLIGQANEMVDELELAMVAYMSTQHRFPESPFAEEAAFGRARCLVQLTKDSPNDEETLEQAYAAAVVFLNAYPKSEHAGEVTGWKERLLHRRAEIAYSRGIFYDRNARQPKAALMSYENFVRMYPDSQWTPVARERIAQLRPIVEKVNTK